MKKFVKVLLIAIICVFVTLETVYHFKMNWMLKPLKQEFIQVAKNADYKVKALHHADGTSYLVDYNGQLDAILLKRDKFLKENGYTVLGGWYAKDYRYADFSAIYLRVKF